MVMLASVELFMVHLYFFEAIDELRRCECVHDVVYGETCSDFTRVLVAVREFACEAECVAFTDDDGVGKEGARLSITVYAMDMQHPQGGDGTDARGKQARKGLLEIVKVIVEIAFVNGNGVPMSHFWILVLRQSISAPLDRTNR